jgi:hypothetical protein
MSSEVALSENHDPGKGLPPVAPPSGKFIVQLFLVPGIIVVVAVILLMGATWLVGGESTPDALLAHLENSNEQVRWRAANEIAQRLTRDDNLASDPKVALRLSSLLQKAMDELNKANLGPGEADRQKDGKTVLTRRKDVEFLCACVGKLMLPTGVPLLTELALRKNGTDPKTIVLLRRQAVWSLANLGANLKRFDALPQEQKENVLEELRLATIGKGGSAQWAQLTLDYLEGRRKNIGVIDALAKCADTARDPADDPFLRLVTAHALTSWPDGDAAEQTLAENTLVALAHDNGHGVRIEIGEND